MKGESSVRSYPGKARNNLGMLGSREKKPCHEGTRYRSHSRKTMAAKAPEGSHRRSKG